MGIDKNISWSPVSPFAIRFAVGLTVDECWHAGCVRDVIVAPQVKGKNGEVLVATDTGGVWLVRSDGTGVPAADWDKPDMWCLASMQTPDSCVYAGGSGLYATRSFGPPFQWREIELLFVNAQGLVAPTGAVYRIAVMNEARIIVIACANGVFWSAVPPDPQNGLYQWKQALGLPSQNIRGFFGLTLGNIIDDAKHRRVIVSSWGTPDAPTRILKGHFNPLGQLQFDDATIIDGLIQLEMRATSLASGASDPPEMPATMYAVSAGDDGMITAVLRSIDGGFTWKLLSPGLGQPPSLKKFIDMAGNQGNDSRPCNAIAVSPQHPNTVAIAWRHEGLLYSTDGGVTWEVTFSSLHLHSDLHTVYFDPTDSSGQRVYVGSDGGMVLLPWLGASPEGFVSKFNRELLNLQFQSPTSGGRSFWGCFAASDVYKFAAGGLQDNGMLSCALDQIAPQPWLSFGDGDGGLALTTRTGRVLYYDNDKPHDHVWDAQWALSRVNDVQIPPVTVQDPQLSFPAGLSYISPDNLVADPITDPRWRNSSNQLMYAVAGIRSSLFGFFSDPSGANPHWEWLSVDLGRAGSPVTISSVGSFDGTTVFFGTNGGRLFAYLQNARRILELPVPPRHRPEGDDGASIDRVVPVSSELAFATFNTGSNGFVLRARLSGRTDVLSTGLPNETFYGLAFAPLQRILFAATDGMVFDSRDEGTNLGDVWNEAAQGLPLRPHCSDLRFAIEPDGTHLYLATYGRSAWRAAVK